MHAGRLTSECTEPVLTITPPPVLRALRGLAGFVRALKVKYQDIEVGLDFEPEPGLADNGDLESDLQDLLEVVGTAAKAADACVALLRGPLQQRVGLRQVDRHRRSALGGLELHLVRFGHASGCIENLE